jgi:hypothetical protein
MRKLLLLLDELEDEPLPPKPEEEPKHEPIGNTVEPPSDDIEGPLADLVIEAGNDLTIATGSAPAGYTVLGIDPGRLINDFFNIEAHTINFTARDRLVLEGATSNVYTFPVAGHVVPGTWVYLYSNGTVGPAINQRPIGLVVGTHYANGQDTARVALSGIVSIGTPPGALPGSWLVLRNGVVMSQDAAPDACRIGILIGRDRMLINIIDAASVAALQGDA